MTGQIFVKPAVDGALVRRPHREFTPLPQGGDFVPDNMYWRRRILHGDVIEATPPEPAPEAPAAA
jgi:hypothetical protein